jgi:hypothetical protein
MPRLFLFSSGVSSLPLGNGTRQGPIPQFLQQLPTEPMGQGFICSALSKARLTWSAQALSINSRLAVSTLFFFFPSSTILLLPPQIIHKLSVRLSAF